MKDKKIWAALMHLSMNMWYPQKDHIPFDDEVWDCFLEKAAETGINMVVLDVGDGVQFKSHPEISLPDSWSAERVHKEVAKCRELGIELIPKLNFSTSHSYWMGEYRRMTSSKPYYDFCKDVLAEIYEMFEQPRYIHIGMDEEDFINTRVSEYAVYRKGNLLMHDIKFLSDVVNGLGAKPWIWHDPTTDYTEEFTEMFSPDEIIISPWWYWHYNGKEKSPIITDFEGLYANRGIQYEEDIPLRRRFLERILPLMDKGYKYIPTPSNFYKMANNTDETVEYFKNGTPSDDQILGYMTAPWRETISKYKDDILESLELLKEAREKYYK